MCGPCGRCLKQPLRQVLNAGVRHNARSHTSCVLALRAHQWHAIIIIVITITIIIVIIIIIIIIIITFIITAAANGAVLPTAAQTTECLVVFVCLSGQGCVSVTMCAYASISVQAGSMILHAKKHICTVNVAPDSAAAVAATTAADIATAASVCSPDCNDGLRVNMDCRRLWQSAARWISPRRNKTRKP